MFTIVKVINTESDDCKESKYIVCPDILWDRALDEKKNVGNLDRWVRCPKPKFYELHDYLQKRAGCKISIDLERIKIIWE